MDQIFELLKANQEKMDVIEHKMMAKMDAMQVTMDSQLEETRAWLGEMKACQGVTPVCLEEEPAPEVTEAVEKPQEVPEGATGEETIGVTEDRSLNLRLAVRCRGRLKTRTKCDGRLRQECAATVGRPTRRFVPAMRKGGLRKGPGKKCRSGIKGPGRTLGSRMGGPSLKKRRTKFNVVQGTPKDRTCEKRQRSQPEFNHGIRRRSKTPGNGMREMIGRQRRLLERKKTHSEAIRKSLGMETAKWIEVVSPIGLREPGDWLLWKCRPPQKRKR
jgi:hypothetical protein